MFADALRAVTNQSVTENGAVAHASTLDPIVDFFALAGAMRNRPQDAVRLFTQAFIAEPLSAVKVLMYLRDVRGGQGERDIFRACYRQLTAMDPVAAARLLPSVPTYGRWDDIFHIGFAPDDPAVLQLVSNQINMDTLALISGQPVSLLAKWLPQPKGAQKAIARQLRMGLGVDEATYRKALVTLRQRIGLLETDMTEGNWDTVDFATIPGQAHRRHLKAFYRNAEARYTRYIEQLQKGEVKANTGTMYPHELYDQAMSHYTPAVNALWDNLPDYTQGNDALVIADVSGSMTWYGPPTPMSVAVSLALYFAERNKGDLNGYFMTFSDRPQLIKVHGQTLQRKLQFIKGQPWGGSTNVEAAFRAILAAGKISGSVPKTLYIISDMQFNQAVRGGHSVAPYQKAKAEFAAAGFELPHVVFWNVNARDGGIPATIHDGHVSLVSGFSPTIFAMAVQGLTPRQLVDQVIERDRYRNITI